LSFYVLSKEPSRRWCWLHGVRRFGETAHICRSRESAGNNPQIERRRS
jgi:hypothetical protein